MCSNIPSQPDSLHADQRQPDQLHRFLFTKHDIRGELVCISDTWQQLLNNHHYPPAVQTLLGEVLVATSLLTATLKFAGDITVQLQGDGPLKLLVINSNHQQQLRGVARLAGDVPEQASLTDLLGNGIMVITLTPEQGERYQGVVDLDGDSLSTCLENYFQRSEQLATRLFIHTTHQHGQPVAAGILLQTLPARNTADNEPVSVSEQPLSINHPLNHLGILTDTLTSHELCYLPAEQVLWRLYHEEEVTLYPPQAISFHCSCSRQRCLDVLATLSKQEITAMLQQQNSTDMHCDYCGQHYLFSADDLSSLLNV